MPYNLRRTTDRAGDSGMESVAIEWNEDGTFKKFSGDTPLIGCSMRVGCLGARSSSAQDYWITTPITEILEEIKNESVHYIRFKTKNSEYEWWAGEYPGVRNQHSHLRKI